MGIDINRGNRARDRDSRGFGTYSQEFEFSKFVFEYSNISFIEQLNYRVFTSLILQLISLERMQVFQNASNLISMVQKIVEVKSHRLYTDDGKNDIWGVISLSLSLLTHEIQVLAKNRAKFYILSEKGNLQIISIFQKMCNYNAIQMI